MKENVAESSDSRMRRLDALSRLLDSAFSIPGTRFRIGLDGLLGLIPGIGDSLGAALSAYIIVEAARLGAPKRLLLRMIGNVAVEGIVGAVPIVGDVFDIVWKANVKNVALLRTHRDALERQEQSSRQLLSFFIIAIILAVIGIVAGGVLVLRLLYQLITS
ncbi:MAG TPA: DUF4112 domain-containing protein [Candidatus Binatia bacterium]|nr:DUF4112 domain-containing protein [Candidatus Binatia bacterium]